MRWSEEICARVPEGAGRVMAVEQIDKVGGCLVVEGFVSEEEYFELNPLRDGEPVEFLEDVGDVVTGAGVGE